MISAGAIRVASSLRDAPAGTRAELEIYLETQRINQAAEVSFDSFNSAKLCRWSFNLLNSARKKEKTAQPNEKNSCGNQEICRKTNAISNNTRHDGNYNLGAYRGGQVEKKLEETYKF